MFIPQPKVHDGSPSGNSYISLWHSCKRKWYYEFLLPWEDGSRGLAPQRGALYLGSRGLAGPGCNYMLGSLLHAYREAWYLSGVKDGEDTGAYSHEQADAALATYATSRRNEFAADDAFDWALASIRRLGEAFHQFFGPDGYTPLWPEEQVLCLPDGRPAVELEFAVPLGYRDYVYTCRYDALTLLHGKYVLAQEHKTAAPSWVTRYIERLGKSSQFTGELFVLLNHEDLRQLPWEGLQVNYHIKGWTPKSTHARPVLSGKTARSPEALERFRLRAARTLEEIDMAVAAFEEGLAAGQERTYLEDLLFPETGEHNGWCFSYASECEFMGVCKLGAGPGTLGSYRPARPPGEPLKAIRNTPTDEEG